MFDFANQAYTLLIITVIFPVLFTTVIVGDSETGYRMGNLLWSAALALSYLLVVLTAPALGVVMDRRASKKKFLFASWIITIISSGLLYFVEPGAVIAAMTLLIISNFSYASGENIIASFLPSLGPPGRLGRISGLGWALGYAGGLVSAGFVLFFLGEATAENYGRIRWVGPFAALFFLTAALPTFAWLKEPATRRFPGSSGSPLKEGVAGMRRTLKEISRFRDLGILFISVFFTMSGIYIVIAFTFIYGQQVIGWDRSSQALMFVFVQVSAALGALLFGFLQDRIGAKLTYMITLLLWFSGVLGISGVFEITAWLNRAGGFGLEVHQVFLGIGILAGTSLGSSQSSARALTGIFTPRSRAAEFFGFWGVFNKLAGVFGIAGIGVLQARLGLQRAVLLSAFLFLAAIVAVFFVNPDRGIKAAESYSDPGIPGSAN